MIEAPLPHDEELRLAELARLKLLDSPPEIAYDRITDIAAKLFGAPIALVSLVDRERQWFKAVVGLATRETPRRLSFCAHAILEDKPLVVLDATRDARFNGNDLVTGAPGIRFYVGAQLRTRAGFPLGTLCAIDDSPRAGVKADDIAILEKLADLVVRETELRAALAAERQSARAAREASMAKSELLARAGHELRTPLNAILGFSEMLMGQMLGPIGHERYAEYATDIHRSGQILLEFVNSLIEVGRTGRGELPFTPAPVEIGALTRDVVAALSVLAVQRSITLLTLGLDQAAHVEGDAMRLRQVVINLLSNALKYSDSGDTVRVRMEVLPQLVGLIVEDEGIGIEEGMMERIFQPFEQGTHGRGGLGLGLPLVRQTVEQHGGRVTVQSEPGRGSRFTVTLPLKS